MNPSGVRVAVCELWRCAGGEGVWGVEMRVW